jgi:hypothetical protein
MSDEWPFSDPPNLATYTVERVLRGTHPVLYVSHDVSDGAWQFLTGDDVALEDAKLVCLADVVNTDTSLRELSDLPLGWYAERATPAAPWTRRAGFPIAWQELLAEAQSYTRACQERLKDEFSLLQWERYDYSEEASSLIFSSNCKPGDKMSIQIIGSWSALSKSWLWACDNDSILTSAAECVHLLKTYGEQHGFERLATPYWTAEEVDAWEMAATACLLLHGDGVYRAPHDDLATFMVVRQPEWIRC